MPEQLEILQYFWKALVVGLLVTLCASLLGVTLVLRRFSMIGDGLSHIGFGALAVAAAFGWAPLPVAIPAVIAAAFLLLRGGGEKLRGDAAVALLSAGCLALGVLVLTLSGGSNVDLMSYMFGSLLYAKSADVLLCLALSVVVLTGFGLFYHRIFSVTFDEPFARATGVRTSAYQLLTAILTAVTIVLGMRMMGTLLISSLVIFPALIAMRVCKSFFGVTLTAAASAVACYLIGFALTCFSPRGLPTGATIVTVNLCAFGLFACIGWARSRRKAHCDPPHSGAVEGGFKT
ncbi:MAG: metal ABC transporter permease [Oscillospiraceae bacterium]|jgi:zinc transport system permease protein|nr:metal ABC transporter permease [Oscillospiraceae bacterium]